METITAFEKSCVASLAKRMDELESFLLFRALQSGHTALFEMEEREFLSLLSLDTPTPSSKKLYSEFKDRVKNGGIAFPRFRHMERLIAEEIGRRIQEPFLQDAPRVDQERVNGQQREAIEAAIRSPIFFLTGGPGTGKTYTAGLYLKRLLACRASSSLPLQVVLLAPTGKAAKTLEKSIRRALLHEDEGKISLSFMTLHAFLKRSHSLRADVALIDESSMIDCELFYLFLTEARNIPRLFFLGDPGQLPPVEAGQPFSDIVGVLLKRKDAHMYRLTTCERTEACSLLDFAYAVQRGERIDESLFTKEVQFIEADSRDSWKKCEQHWLKEVFSPWQEPLRTIEEAECLSTSSVLLTPERKGAAGSEQIIHRASRVLPLLQNLYAPLLSTKNSYELEVMNGEIGLLKRGKGHLEEVFFETRKVPLVLLEQWQMAYAMTVHKSQGSEFDRVHLLLPKSAILSRKLLYTAATRARKVLYLYGTKEMIQKAIATSQERMTFLSHDLDRFLIKST